MVLVFALTNHLFTSLCSSAIWIFIFFFIFISLRICYDGFVQGFDCVKQLKAKKITKTKKTTTTTHRIYVQRRRRKNTLFDDVPHGKWSIEVSCCYCSRLMILNVFFLVGVWMRNDHVKQKSIWFGWKKTNETESMKITTRKLIWKLCLHMVAQSHSARWSSISNSIWTWAKCKRSIKKTTRQIVYSNIYIFFELNRTK